MIYLDNAATSLIKPASVERAVVRAMRSMASPGRGGHIPAMRAAETVYSCREAAAELFHVEDPAQVVFTMNATHGLNLAIQSLARRGDPVVISGFEHNSVTRPLYALGTEIRIAGRRLFDREDVLNAFDRMLSGARLAVCTHVSNVFGFILPIDEIAQLCKEKGVPLIVDASQSAGVLDVDMRRSGAAYIAMPGHKALFGPQGTGILLCAEPGRALIHGGSGSESLLQRMPDFLPDHLEAGTHNVCGIAGLREGLRYVSEKGTEAIFAHERRLLDIFLAELADTDAEIYTGAEQCGVVSLRSRRLDAESVAALLAERGVCVRSGLHCAPTAHESAGTLETGTVRFSFSPFLTEGQIREACRIVQEII